MKEGWYRPFKCPKYHYFKLGLGGTLCGLYSAVCCDPDELSKSGPRLWNIFYCGLCLKLAKMRGIKSNAQRRSRKP